MSHLPPPVRCSLYVSLSALVCSEEEERPMSTLRAALKETDEHRWRGMRSRPRNYGQGLGAIESLERTATALPLPRDLRASAAKWVASGMGLAVPKDLLKYVVRTWLNEGLAPSTAIIRLNCLSACGVDVRGCRPRKPNALKWWLSPQQEEVVVPYLRVSKNPVDRDLADLIEWTTRTGLRIEESLALAWTDVYVRPRGTSITVPGLKTQSAQATIPVSEGAVEVLERRRLLGTGRVFEANYWSLCKAWQAARTILELDNPGRATLKALRRSAARRLTVKGMPAQMLKSYLRHEDLKTTMGYLRLTGGYSEEELGKWL